MLRVGKWLGALAAAFGVLRITMGFIVAGMAETPEELRALSRRYLGSKLSGEAIDQGIMALIVGIALYALCTIAINSKREGK